MLTENELLELCHQRHLSGEAIAAIRHIRKSPPSRIVRSGVRNVVTHYASRKMGCVIKAEARRTELAAIYEWDHDRATYEFYDQPPPIKKIHIRADGRTSGSVYTPDFFRIAEDFIGWIECKPEGWLLEQAAEPSPQYVRDDAGVWRCPAAERYASSLGLDFAVRSSAESDPIVTQNIADLSDYFREDCPAPTQQDLRLSQEYMGEVGWCWLSDLLANEAGLSADAIYKLIADEHLHVDLHIACLVKEPHRIRVFRTKALLESCDLWLPSMLAAPALAIHHLKPTPGTALLWDGKPGAILNLGETSVFLRMGEDGPILELPITEFEQLAGLGTIVGTTLPVDPRAQEAAELLRRASAEDMRSALHRHKSIHPDHYTDEEKTCASPRSIRKWKQLARQGLSRYGNEFVGLIPSIRLRGNRKRRPSPSALEIMHKVIKEEVKSKAATGIETSWSIVTSLCAEEGVMAPSLKTFRAEIKRITSPEELKKAREGDKAGYNLEVPYISIERETPRHGTRPFELAHIDHTQLDLQCVHEGTGMEMGKPWLTVLIDAFTRMILAWVITFDEPSYRSCMLVIRDCVRRHHRIPQTIVSDQGPEFKSTYYDQLLAFLGVHKRLRPASKPRSGSLVERFFGLSNTAFIHALRGNNKALQSPRSMSPTHDPRELAVWNLRALREGFEGYLASVYHAADHSALGISPSKAMQIGMLQAGTRSHTLIAYDRDFLIATMPTTDTGSAKIQRNCSFKANSIEYFSPSLSDHVGEKLDLRYDPFDVSRAYVMGESGWLEAHSTFHGELLGRSEKEIEIISQEIAAIKRRQGIRDKGNAQLLGDYMQSVRKKESLLAIERQQARDQELHSSDRQAGLVALPSDDADTPLLPGAPSTKRIKTPTKSTFELAFEALPQ